MTSPVGAVEVPSGSAFTIQTDGPNTPVGRGDFYTSTAAGAGAGYHYLEFTIGCDWPSTLPVVVDLFSPEMVQSVAVNSGGSEEYSGALDNTEFELYPGVTPGPGAAQPAPGTGTVRTVYTPKTSGPETWENFATLAAPVACGVYTLRAATSDDDQNGWSVRVGADTDNDITTPPVDDADGIPGTNDEIILGLAQTSYQQNSGSPQCFPLYEFVPSGLSSIRVNNFDYDGYNFPFGADVSYKSPSGVVTPGTVSAADGTWNGSNTIARGGDLITNPEGGWWEFTSCMASNNQFIQEGVQGIPSYMTQPPTPVITLTKDDGQTTVSRGQQLTYAVTATNTSTGANAGAATAVHFTDTLPAGVSFVSCAFAAPATGTCSQSGGVIDADLAGSLNSGTSVVLNVVGTVTGLAIGTQTNTVTIDFEDSFGNAFPTQTATDVDTIPAGNASIGDTVFFDADADGVQDVGEAGIGAVTVTLTGPGMTTTQVVTNANGLYNFTGLYAGSYSVAVTSGQAAGTTATLGSAGYSLLIGQGDVVDTADFGFTGSGSIGSTVWQDLNANGVVDAGEPAIPGADMHVTSVGIDGVGGTADDIDQTVITDSNGHYLARNLPVGTYNVAIVASSVAPSLDLVSGQSNSTVQLTTLALNRLDVNLGYRTSPAALASTGRSIAVPVIAMLLACGVGGLLILTTRRRPARRH